MCILHTGDASDNGAMPVFQKVPSERAYIWCHKRLKQELARMV